MYFERLSEDFGSPSIDRLSTCIGPFCIRTHLKIARNRLPVLLDYSHSLASSRTPKPQTLGSPLLRTRARVLTRVQATSLPCSADEGLRSGFRVLQLAGEGSLQCEDLTEAFPSTGPHLLLRSARQRGSQPGLGFFCLGFIGFRA